MTTTIAIGAMGTQQSASPTDRPAAKKPREIDEIDMKIEWCNRQIAAARVEHQIRMAAFGSMGLYYDISGTEELFSICLQKLHKERSESLSRAIRSGRGDADN